MTRPIDAVPDADPQVYASQAYTSAPEGLPPVEDAAAESPHQEINARRARVENAELLEHLRGL